MKSGKIVGQVQEKYRENYLKHGNTPKGTFQNDQETQYLRYERLMRHILPQPAPFSIHDVGCGICDLHQYLLDQDAPHEYSGTEIVPEMIDQSRLRYPKVRLYHRDLVSEPTTDTYDFVVLSGTLNLPAGVSTEIWDRFCVKLVGRMFEMAQKGVSFNFLTTHNTFSDGELFYVDPGRMLTHCLEDLSRFVLLDHAYPLYEATVTVFREEYCRKQYPSSTLDKYFT